VGTATSRRLLHNDVVSDGYCQGKRSDPEALADAGPSPIVAVSKQQTEGHMFDMKISLSGLFDFQGLRFGDEALRVNQPRDFLNS
jgi:hypothetical protein